MKVLLSCVIITIAIGCSGCGTDNGSSCGTASNPEVMTLADLTPPIGGTVVNKDIVQRFTVVDAPGIMTNITMGMVTGSHTAGNATIADQTWKITTAGKDITYEMTVSSWEKAPAHVEMVPVGGWVVDGCYFTLPSPTFAYDVTVN
jgi:hypothetical protein